MSEMPSGPRQALVGHRGDSAYQGEDVGTARPRSFRRWMTLEPLIGGEGVLIRLGAPRIPSDLQKKAVYQNEAVGYPPAGVLAAHGARSADDSSSSCQLSVTRHNGH